MRPGSTRSETPWRTSLGRRVLEAGDALQRGQRHLGGGRVAEAHVVELDGDRAGRQRRRVGGVDDRRLEVEHLEHPLEADERRHHVDLHVGQRGQRPVQPVEVGGQGDERADAERAGDRHHAAEPVDERGGERGEQAERRHHDAGVHRRGDADVADPAGAVGERAGLRLRAAEQLDEQGARDVEALGHHLAHLAVEAVPLAGDVGEAAPDPAGGEHEQRQQGEREQRDLPRQDEHRGERRDDGDDVADDVGQRRRERLLGALHVGVEAGDEGAGLGPAEEADRHPLDVVEDLGAQVVDEALADARREPALGEADGGGDDGEHGDEAGEGDDEAGALLLDALVDDAAVDERRRRAGEGVDDDEGEEDGDRAGGTAWRSRRCAGSCRARGGGR